MISQVASGDCCIAIVSSELGVRGPCCDGPQHPRQQIGLVAAPKDARHVPLPDPCTAARRLPIRLPRRRVGGTVMPSAFETKLEFGRLLHRQGSGRGWRRRRYFFKYSFIFSASSATLRKVSS